MDSRFAGKLAFNNIKMNSKFYLPYILASTGIIAMFYIVTYLATNRGLQDMKGSEYISFVMLLGSVVIGVFAVIFLFYINSFLMKRRSREIGLYNILGMEKKHIGKILFMENLITSIASIASGLVTGILFSKLAFMLVRKVMGFDTPIVFTVSVQGILASIILFGVLFLLILLKNQMKIHLSQPIELLNDTSAGEREPKSKKVLAAIGAACIGAGYYIAITIQDPLEALLWFFIAVLLVIAGTYLLFTVISIEVLKALKKNKTYYYKPQHFTAVSGMLYRMKQNAVGMANICILSTMVLVMVSTTVCLQVGIRDVVQSIVPQDAVMTICDNDGSSALSDKELDKCTQVFLKSAEKSGVYTENLHSMSYVMTEAVKTGRGAYKFKLASNGLPSHVFLMMPARIYERITGEKVSLNDDQIITAGARLPGEVSFNGLTFQNVKDSNVKVPTDSGTIAAATHVIVFADDDVLDSVVKKAGGAKGIVGTYFTAAFDTDADAGKIDSIMDNSEASAYDAGHSNYSMSITVRSELESGFYGLTGGFLFLGIFLGIVFTFAAGLIIYYKQISEGYYDQGKYEIMQKVGMSMSEIKRSVRTQTLLVFFAPLAVAGIHMAAAFNMIQKMLLIFGISNVSLFAECSLITFLAFAAIYAFIYAMTSREYYKIVR